jgi:hypothetical protein
MPDYTILMAIVGGKMNLKARYRRGFRLARLEHETRYFAIKVMIAGVLVLGAGYYYWNKLVILIAMIVIAFSVVIELLSLIAHTLEKRTMNSIRHKRS